MSFSPKTFLRQTSNNLVRRCFELTGEPNTIPWDHLKPNEIEPIYAHWQNMPDRKRLQIEKVFEEVEALATENGIKALIDEGNFHQIDLTSELDQHPNFRDKALHVALTYPNVFQVAGTMNHADSLSTRYSRRREDMPKHHPDVSGPKLSEFSNAVSLYFRENEGRGHHCTVENYLRTERFHYFFAYPDNYASTYLSHNDEGVFLKLAQRPTFEIVFHFDPVDGVLDINAQGGKVVQESLQTIFCRTLLGEDLPPESLTKHPYELNVMKKRSFLDVIAQTDADDGISNIEIRKMRLSLLGGGKRRITLEMDPEGGPESIYDMLDKCIHRENIPDAMLNVTQAQFHFSFFPVGQARPRILKFEVSHPNSSNLKSCKNESLRLVGEKYLQRWGIVNA